MRFHKKIFIVFFGLSMMSTRGAIGFGLPDQISLDPIIFPVIGVVPIDDYTNLAEGDHYPCGEADGVPIPNRYIAKCDFTWYTGVPDDTTTPDINESELTFKGVPLTPEGIFAFIAATTGYLCWDFDDPKKNYENLRILFGSDHSAKLECYTGEKGSAEEKLHLIRTNQRPLTQKISFPYEASGGINTANYKAVAWTLRVACDEKSIINHQTTYCQTCPNDGKSEPPKFEVIPKEGWPDLKVVDWKSFTTIADCYHWDNPDDHTHEDNTGSFKYITDRNGGNDELPEHGACYYSGE